MSVAITIRDVPDETRDKLAARAAEQGQSMQEYLRRQLIALATRSGNGEVLARIVAQNHAMPKRVSSEEIVRAIREDRDSH